MDPNEALRLLRNGLAYAQALMDQDTDSPSYCVVPNGTVQAILNNFEALDEWITNGGFLPAEWSN